MDAVKQSHVEEYGKAPEIIASAPGRVNLIGEHTDYNDGFVFPMAIDFTARVAVTRRKDSHLRFFSVDYKDRKRATLPTLRYRKEDRWANYPKGIIAEFVGRGHALGGMDITIHGDIPQGAGLSSSAALEVATALAIQDLFGIEMGREELAKLAQRAENDFVGVKSGIMDQFISRLAKEGHGMLLDTRFLTYHYVPLALKSVKILITNSKVPHGLVDSEYNHRREECRKCVELLQVKRPGVALRDYSPADVRDSLGLIPEATRKKCLHVVEENQRVLEAEEALRKKDLVTFGKLMNRSHESLRDLYEVSCPELDWLVKRAWETEGVYGSRLTGAGFGGCTVTLIEESAIPLYKEHIVQYERIFGFRPELYICKPSAGAKNSRKQDAADVKILLTNDDGIGSEGIRTLIGVLSPAHDVWVVAPETEKSGGSHSITLRDSIRVRKLGDRMFSCRGTTADCVMVSVLGLVPEGIELVISGINHGPNLGTDILYSGTAAGARQGALMGIPSVALSTGRYVAPFDFITGAEFAARNLEIFRELGTDDHFLNINFPASGNRDCGTVITFPSRRIYRDELSKYVAPNGDIYCFMGGALPDAHPEEGSDCMVLSQGRISISPIHAHPRNWASIEENYRGVKFR